MVDPPATAQDEKAAPGPAMPEPAALAMPEPDTSSSRPPPTLPPHPPNEKARSPPYDGSLSDSDSDSEAPAPAGPLPDATHPTVALIIPFPRPLRATDKQLKKLPPFVLYAPLAAPVTKPPEGEKEGLAHKAQRKWQEEEREAREKGTGFKAKAAGLRMIYPASYSADDIKTLFTDLIKKAKAGAIRNSIISTAMLPFVLAFDIFTFISGVRPSTTPYLYANLNPYLRAASNPLPPYSQPFEINAVWAASSWAGAAQASAISSRITSDKLPLSFSPDAALDIAAYRMWEICWGKAKPGVVDEPRCI
ncbi:hypothetical protein NEOLEDRAFT_1143865 [Neolentinus lepideus HHB14362 ss-1]|uniref:Uncharacterized protein n=1 Tax=Neolentinus lepideus HHB14362 ss-1 TaxID=1314782 RepID=A0A165M9T1_9AGAM|nr:hypothetical protein NEOLEDRAFT_1143865 [Neolentinus lepideus HHB14362 ss-1]